MPRMTKSSLRWKQAGHPVVRIVMKSIDHLGQEFFRFEMATAVAGAILGINPFNQPDVEAAKIKTRELTGAFEKTGALPAETAGRLHRRGRPLHRRAQRRRAAQGRRRRHARLLDQGASVAHRQRRLCCAARLYRARRRLISTRCRRCGWRCATKSMSRPAPNSGRASCIRPARPTRAGRTAACSCRSPPTRPRICQVPGQKASFGVIKAAQARGDFDVLTERGRRALRVHLKGDLAAGAGGARCRDLGSAELREDRNAARHDRPRPDGRQHRPPADEARAYRRRLRQGCQGGRGAGGRGRGRRRHAGGFRREAGEAAHRLGDAAGRQDHRSDRRDAGEADAARRRHHRRRQHASGRTTSAAARRCSERACIMSMSAPAAASGASSAATA